MAIRNLGNQIYEVDVSCGFNEYGKRLRIRRKIKGKKNAEKLESDLRSKREKHSAKSEFGSNDIVLLIDEYFEWCYKTGKVKKDSSRSKRSVFNNHIIPFFKKINNINKINEIAIEDFHETLNRKKISNGTKRKIHTQLSAFLSFCNKKHYIDYNYASSVGNFKKEKKEEVYLTLEEFNRLRAIITNLRDLFIIDLLFLCGLRISEALGLKITDFDLKTKSLNITETVYEGKIRPYGKTDDSLEKVYFDEITEQDYLNYIENSCITKYLFPGRYNNSVLSDTALRQMLKKYLQKAGINLKISPHKLRHGQAALLISLGMNLQDVKDRMRHSDIRTTSNEYGHMYNDRKIKMAKKISNILKNGEKN